MRDGWQDMKKLAEDQRAIYAGTLVRLRVMLHATGKFCFQDGLSHAVCKDLIEPTTKPPFLDH
jgi:hypothetical protein